MKNVVVFLFAAVLLVLAGCSTSETSDPVSVVKAFHGGLNDGDIDAAMAVVADDALFKQFGGPFLEGHRKIKAYYQYRVIAIDAHAEMSDFQVDGDTVTYTIKINNDLRPEYYRYLEAIVQEGKIVSFDADGVPRTE